MNTSLTAYTHLESLLLFQSLHAYGVGPQVFSRISELLKSNPHIAADKRFQSGRLSPDALRNFYLDILKDEIKSEGAVEPEPQNGEVKSSRKRKAPSPSLPTVQDSVQHQHLIPKLVNKLYARYRAAITDQIRHDEDRYDKLQRELEGIERGEWDDQLRERLNGKSAASRSPSLPMKSPLLQQKQLPPHSSPQLGVRDGARDKSPIPAPAVDGPQSNPPVLEPAKALLPQNGDMQPEHTPKKAANQSSRRKSVVAEKQGAPSTPQPLASPIPLPQTQTPQPLAPPPRLQSQPPSDAGLNGSPFPHPLPYPPPQLQAQTPQIRPSTSSPHPPIQVQPPPPAAGSPPSVPKIQPHPEQPLGGNGVPPYGPPNAPPQTSPTHQPFPVPHLPGAQSPGVQTPQQQRNFFPYPGRPPYSSQQSPMSQPPPQSGFMLPPFQVSPQDPSRAHQQPAPPTHYPQVSTPISARHPHLSAKITPSSASVSRQGVPPMHPLVTQARLSFSTPTGMRTPNSAASTPRSAKTVWKASARNFATPPTPRPEVKPIDDILPVESPEHPLAKTRPARKPRARKAKEKEPGKEPEQEVEEAVPEVETRRGRSRRKAPTKKARPGSIASSQAGRSVRERSRSQSILSHTETVAADNESQVSNRIKSERGNSMDVVEEDSAATPSHISTRRRGGTLQSLQPNNKRKRTARDASLEEHEEQPSTPGTIPKTVIAPRHFSRMCSALMNDIGSHKHASTFTTAVKAKDAEGYYDIIKRPTDLKSIQKAIAAGAKQVAAYASDTPAGSPGGGGGIVELPVTLDNIPPKAIVNSGQLEKELMRMFVNAVMFNAGEDGVVEDARQMFDSVDKSVSTWRSIGRSSGRPEVEETPPVQEDDAPATSKRRKL